jgi:hypothetical protein
MSVRMRMRMHMSMSTPRQFFPVQVRENASHIKDDSEAVRLRPMPSMPCPYLAKPPHAM